NSKFIKTVKIGNVITGSSSPPNAMVAAALKGLEIAKNNPELRLELWENAKYLKRGIRNLGLKVDDNYFPIVTFSLGTGKEMEQLHQELMEMGIYIQYVKYVGSGSKGVLRIVVTSSHSKEQIDFLVSSLEKLI
ncbi:MAG: aminotransferase class I/II-fold pyridoxal phosphate-dependent enzyme, partial [Lutibacter sp.]